MAKKIIACSLSYNADVAMVRESLKEFRSQVDHIVICDNGSAPEIRQGLKGLETEFPGFISFVWNEKNLGNAGGLNREIQAAMDAGAYWIMPIDDNSRPTPNMTNELLAAYEALSESDKARVGMVKPNYTTEKGLAYKETKPFIAVSGFSSGELVKADVYQKIGLYQEDLFIDFVDSEFSHRAFRKGILSLIVPDTILRHQRGHPTVRKFLWMTASVPNYPPSRYYYIARNGAYLYLRNFNEYFLHSVHRLSKFWIFVVPRYLIKAVLFEDRKMKKISMVLRGTWDGLRGKLGKLQE